MFWATTTTHTDVRQARPEPRKLIVCLDGTWNDPTDDSVTNVLRLHQAVDQGLSTQESLYFAGVGNEAESNKPETALEGFTGWGAREIRQRAYVELALRYRRGDQVFVFGFSRGAAIARMLCGMLHERGIPEILKVARSRDGNVLKITGQGATEPADIAFLGVWDTVAAFGLPWNDINLFRDFRVCPNVRQAYHLVSIDETRRPFQATLMNKADNVEEIWFPGVHSDIGGGYAERGLGDITLQFMMNRAADHGLVYRSTLPFAVRPDALDTIHGERIITKVHRDVMVIDDDEATGDKPKVHHSVFDRMAGDAKPNAYNPPNVGSRDNYIVIDAD